VVDSETGEFPTTATTPAWAWKVSSPMTVDDGDRATGPLSGIVVADFTRVLAGPLTTMVLGDLGADVIKLEMPGAGDETRFWGPPFLGDAGPTLLGFNRSKRSVLCDLHSAEGRTLCLDLARTSDVFVENFKPGTIKRFGLDYEAMRAVRPDIVYCSISGYGQTGPMALRPAVDLMVQAVSGLMSLTGEPGGGAMKAAAPVADVMGGLSAVISIMGALFERQRTGEGRYLDIAMLDGMVALMGQSIAALGMTGNEPRRLGNGHALMSPYESFQTADREIVIAVTNEKTWGSLCQLPECRSLADDPRFETQPMRNENRAALVPAVQAVLRTRPASYWLEQFDRLGVPAEPINTLPELVEQAQVRARDMLLEIEYAGQRTRIAGMPWRAVAAEGPVRSPPSLGQHTDEVLDELKR
jgi:crotonobetainyl-CoA:carnitine CoA-transferase CaiB-like acyl-CoA transferase